MQLLWKNCLQTILSINIDRPSLQPLSPIFHELQRLIPPLHFQSPLPFLSHTIFSYNCFIILSLSLHSMRPNHCKIPTPPDTFQHIYLITTFLVDFFTGQLAHLCFFPCHTPRYQSKNYNSIMLTM